jgi:DNA polymerase III, delta subunit
MKYTEFFSAVKNKAFAPCYLFEGEEEYIKQSALAALRAAVLPEGMESLNENVFENPAADELIAALETMPFMGDYRLVIAKDCAFLSGKGREEDAEKLLKYLEDMPPTSLLVFYVRGTADGRKKLYQKLKTKNAIVTFAPLDDMELTRWVAQTLKPFGKVMTGDTCRYFTFTVGRDVALLKGELQKLCAHQGEREEITKEDIDNVCIKSVECTVFELTDEIALGHTARAITLLNHLLKNGAERIGILQMILRQYRILYHLTLMMADGLSPQQIQKNLGIPPFAVDRARRQAAAYNARSLKKAVDLIMDTDFRIKSGKLSQDGVPENIILTLGAKQWK